MATPFQTPPNEQSFSSLIDDAVLATGKPGSLVGIVQQANLTIRECQGLGLFARDLIEDELAVGAVPFTWSRPALFRKLRTAKYGSTDAAGSRYNTRYPKMLLPGKIQRGECDYFYAADDYFVFVGVFIGDIIGTATYYWAKPLQYFALLGQSTTQYPGGPYQIRPAYYDLNTDLWMYLNTAQDGYVTTTGDVNIDAARRALVSNWLVIDWKPLILSGTKAKVWGSTGDPRATIEYSLYKQVQGELRITSGYEGEGF